jgi:3-hydroxyisobutyrate dehydrogenase-like beta-hydroxyacid dehydrogenase
MCLADISVTREVLLGNGDALAQMRPGVILIDHATGTPEFARELYAEAAKRGIGFLDAPVTGFQLPTNLNTLGADLLPGANRV